MKREHCAWMDYDTSTSLLLLWKSGFTTPLEEEISVIMLSSGRPTWLSCEFLLSLKKWMVLPFLYSCLACGRLKQKSVVNSIASTNSSRVANSSQVATLVICTVTVWLRLTTMNTCKQSHCYEKREG